MKNYKIVYTYFNRGLMEEEEMTLGGLPLPDALAQVRQMAYNFCYEDFAIRQVYAETEDGKAWTEVQDWAEIEYQHEKYLAEQAKREGA